VGVTVRRTRGTDCLSSQTAVDDPNQRTLQSTELPDDLAAALQDLTTDREPPATLVDAVEAFDRLWDLAEVEVTVKNM